MSHDMYFVAPGGANPPGEAEFAEHFEQRRWFELDGGQAGYANEDTGVYFSFELADPEEAQDLGDSLDGDGVVWASINLNYLRPGVFALEACEEIGAFVRRMGGQVFDPQQDDESACEFSVERFLASWQGGNRAAAAAFKGEEGDPARHLVVPVDEMGEAWKWNYLRRARQEDEGGEIFVPLVALFEQGDRVRTGVVWTDALPILMPKVDGVLVHRRSTAPRRFFRKKPDQRFVPFSEVANLFDGTPDVDAPVRLKDPKDPEDRQGAWQFFHEPIPRGTSAPTMLRPDQVLDAELFE